MADEAVSASLPTVKRNAGGEGVTGSWRLERSSFFLLCHEAYTCRTGIPGPERGDDGNMFVLVSFPLTILNST